MNLDDIINILELSEISGDNFVAKSIEIPTGNVYGGQFLAQSLMSASKTVSDYRLPSSIHSYFVNAGKFDEDLEYSVKRLRDGVMISHREVSVTQNDYKKLLFKALIKFHETENSTINYTANKMPNLMSPEEYKTINEIFTPLAKKNKWASYFTNNTVFEIRQVNKSLFLESNPNSNLDAKELVWFRVNPDYSTHSIFNSHKSALYQRALLAFFTDQFAFSPSLRKSGLSWQTKGASYISLDHSQYFYGDFDLRNWHLLVGDSPVGANACGLCVGNIFGLDGNIISNYTQEGYIRVLK